MTRTEKAARILKLCKLAANPMMDNVAIRLNAEPTYAEMQQARLWEKAFELADNRLSVNDAAIQLTEFKP